VIAEFLNDYLLLSPSPSFRHQDAILNLAIRLRDHCPANLRVLLGPFPLRIGRSVELQPDLLVARYVDLTTDGLTDVPLLTVEVRSPGTGQVDRSVKKDLYAACGVPSYWLIDPEEPTLTVYRLDPSGHYEQLAEIDGDDSWQASEPFPVAITPSELVTGLSPPD
jgi:Uma2 family endonuclease